MRTLRVGVIGTGFMGLMHSFAYANLPFYYSPLPFAVKLHGVAGSSILKAQAFAARCGFERAYEDWQALVCDPDIDVVSICTPNALHETMVCAALEAGKAVYCDKPLTVGGQEAARIEAVARKHPGVHAMAMNNRFFPSVLRAREWVESGALGRVTSFRGSYLHSGSVDPQRAMGWKQRQGPAGGGVLLDLGSHLIDLAQYISGQDIHEVCCRAQRLYDQRPDSQGALLPVDAEDAAYLLARLADGGMGTLEASKIATGIDDVISLQIHGTNGALSLDLSRPDILSVYDQSAPDGAYGGSRGFRQIACAGRYEQPGGAFPPAKLNIGWTRAHLHSVYSFLEHLVNGQPHSPSLLDGVRLQNVMDAAYASAGSGKWVECG